MANKHQVLELFFKNPNITSTAIAERLDCESSYVRATLKRAGLRLANSLPGARRGIVALGRAAQDAGLTVADIEKLARLKEIDGKSYTAGRRA